MRTPIYALLLGVLSVPPLAAQDRPFVRVTVEPDTAIAGQAVTITADVLAPNYFTGAPRFSDIEVRDALVVFNDRGINFSEQADGTTWAGQRRSYEAYPQRPGEYRIDDLTVAVSYFDGSERTQTTARAEPFSFHVIVPAEAEGLGYFIAAKQLTIDESFDVRPDTLQVGDAFVRTITISVENALAMVIPPVEIDSIAGIAIYSAPPVVDDDRRERGAAAVGRRIERMTYVTYDAGHYELPPIALAFWDAEAGRWLERSTPAVAFTVLPAPVAEPEFATDDVGAAPVDASRSGRWSIAAFVRRWAVPALSFLALLLASIRTGPWFVTRLRAISASIVRRYRATDKPLQPLNPDR